MVLCHVQNLMKIYRVKTNFCVKMIKGLSRLLYHWKELVKVWHINGVTIVEVSFCDLKGIRKKNQPVSKFAN